MSAKYSKYIRLSYLLIILAGLVVARVLVEKPKELKPEEAATTANATPDYKFNLTYQSSSPVISRSGLYDYSATALTDTDNKTKVWDCGQEGSGIGRDSIVYTTFNSSGSKLSGPSVVMKANPGVISSADSLHTCAPSVGKHKNPDVDPDGPGGPIPQGAELFLMYYECAPLFHNKCDGSAKSTNNGTVTCDPNRIDGVFTQICLAASTDGVDWMKYSSELWNDGYRHYGDTNTPPTPIVKVSAPIADNCGFSEADLEATGKYRAYLQYSGCTGNRAGNYGVGHPSAWIQVFPDGSRRVWLFYIDSHGDWWNSRRIYLAKSWDGFHFDPPVLTNLRQMPDIKYVHASNGLPAMFFAAFTIEDANYFGYSMDGVSWVAPDYDAAYAQAISEGASDPKARALEIISPYKMGAAKPGTLKMLPGSPGLLGNKFGDIISYSNMSIFSGEGQDNLGTWHIYLIKGSLANVASPTPTATNTPKPSNTPTPSPTKTPKPTATNTPKPTKTPTPSPTKSPTPSPTHTPVPLASDLDGDGHVNISDYTILISNFGNTTCGNVADINNDCKVNIFDYNLLLVDYGK